MAEITKCNLKVFFNAWCDAIDNVVEENELLVEINRRRGFGVLIDDFGDYYIDDEAYSTYFSGLTEDEIDSYLEEEDGQKKRA